jgi:uncharacterized protein (TIGR02996 family)
MTAAAFLAAVCAAPDDDTPRLAFADWLEEQGETERAEFIRVQVELASVEADAGLNRMPQRAPGENWNEWQDRYLRRRHSLIQRRYALRRRERELLFSLPGSLWLGDWEPNPDRITHGKLTHIGRPCVLVRRGFVHAITCSCANWLKHAAAILAAQPVREVTLTMWPDPNRYPVLQEEGGSALFAAHLAAEWPGITFRLPGQ